VVQGKPSRSLQAAFKLIDEAGLTSSDVMHLERGVYGWYQADLPMVGEYQPMLMAFVFPLHVVSITGDHRGCLVTCFLCRVYPLGEVLQPSTMPHGVCPSLILRFLQAALLMLLLHWWSKPMVGESPTLVGFHHPCCWQLCPCCWQMWHIRRRLGARGGV
jgi:hypothetical protein